MTSRSEGCSSVGLAEYVGDHRQFRAIGIEAIEMLDGPPGRLLARVGEETGPGEDTHVVGDLRQRDFQLDAGLGRAAWSLASALPTQEPASQRMVQGLHDRLQIVVGWLLSHGRLLALARSVRTWTYTQIFPYWLPIIRENQIEITREQSADNLRLLRHDPLVSEVAQAFGARLAELRVKAGLTQDQLSDLAELHRTEISNLETGKNKNAPRIDTAIKLSGALGVGLCDLLQGLPSWTPPSRFPGGFSVGD